VHYLKFWLVILAVNTSCQTDVFRRPVEPQCIHNEDNSAECTDRDRSYTETNLENYACTPIESFGRYQSYVIELEERLLKCEASQ
jgi:hypothetical protein